MSWIRTAAWVGAIVMASGSVSGTTKTFSPGGGGTGNWNVAGNWSPNGVPTEADDVVVPTGTICNVNVTTAVADKITVESGATLNIQAFQKLTLDNDSGNATIGSTIDGTVNLLGGDSATPTTLAFIDADHIVLGDGSIDGSDATATISIAGNKTLTNQLAGTGEGIRGSLIIVGRTGTTNGGFVNEGLVEAVGHLTLAASTPLEDVDGARWIAISCKTILQFDRQALGLDGDFEVDCGSKLLFNASIKTCGDLVSYDYAGIDVQNSATFQYVGFSGTRANPGTVTGTPSCSNPYTVSADDCCCACP